MKLAPFFDCDLTKLFERSKLFIEFPGQGDEHPCYYYYRGNYRGNVGITFAEEYEEFYLDRFIFHEIIPGHHLYYLIKQSYWDQNKFDPLFTLDIFYSPENIINEGLALNMHSIFLQEMEPALSALNAVERLSHFFFYNAWYSVNIEKNTALPEQGAALLKEMGFSRESAAQYIHYFTVQEKYFAPAYALGQYYVGNFIRNYSMKFIPYLYNQYSVNCLDKLMKELSAREKAIC